jgi:hypothetical protein
MHQGPGRQCQESRGHPPPVPLSSAGQVQANRLGMIRSYSGGTWFGDMGIAARRDLARLFQNQ